MVTRDEALAKAAAIYLEAKIELETRRQLAATNDDAPEVGQDLEGECDSTSKEEPNHV